MSAGRVRRVVQGFIANVAAIGGLVFLLQMLPDPDSRNENVKAFVDQKNDTDIRKALTVHRELKRNGKD